MAYRAPQFCFLHAAKVAGESAITLSVAEATGYPKRHLIDERSALFRFTSPGADRTIIVDRGAAGLEAIDRMLIPSGHNLASATSIKLESGTDGITFGTTMLAAVAVSAGLIDKALTSSTNRYLRLTLTGTFQAELGELYLSRLRSLTRGPDPSWSDSRTPTLQTTQLDSGVVAAVELGSSRRTIRLRYNAVESTDTATLESLLQTVGYGRSPLYVYPPDDADSPIFVELVSYTREQDSPAPGATGLTYRYDVTLREVLG